MKKRISYLAVGLMAGLSPLLSSPASAVTVDLTTAGASGTANGARFVQIAPGPTGTGYIDPFVRVQASPVEEGYNSSTRPVMPDVNTDHNYTHDLRLGDVPVVSLDSGNYYQFMLDINEPNGQNERWLSLHEIEIYLSSSPLANASTYAALTSSAVKAWDLDGAGDSVVELNYNLNHGSGSGDMFMYIPVDTLGRDGSQYLTLYSAFGNPNTSADGFEEWCVIKGPSTVPDASSSVMLLGMVLLGLHGLRRKFRA